MKLEEFEAEIERDLLDQEKRTNEIVSLLLAEQITFRNETSQQEGMVHPCCDQKYAYQFTYFDHKGPIGDFRRNTLKEIAKGILEYRFTPCPSQQCSLLY